MDQRIIPKTSLLIALALSSGAASGNPKQTKARQAAASQIVRGQVWYPDNTTRARARKMNLRDVEYIRVQGPTLGHYGDVAPDITDPKLIAAFLDALKNAETDTSNQTLETAVMDKVDLFEIHFKDQSVWSFPTKFSIPAYCFGPPFQKALVELGKYRAAQFRALLRERGPHLAKALFNAADEPGAEGAVAKYFQTPPERKALLAELERLDENAFAYADSDLDMEVRLFFDDGTTKSLDLILRNWTYHRRGETPKPFPPLIGAFLKEIKSKRNR